MTQVMPNWDQVLPFLALALLDGAFEHPGITDAVSLLNLPFSGDGLNPQKT